MNDLEELKAVRHTVAFSCDYAAHPMLVVHMAAPNRHVTTLYIGPLDRSRYIQAMAADAIIAICLN